MRRAASALRRLFTAFRDDRRGVSALEFALLSPVLLVLALGLNELSRAMMVQRRVNHTASAVGDLVAQSPSLKVADFSNIFNAGSAIILPFSTTPMKLRVSSVTNKNMVLTLDWSQGSGLPALTSPPTDLPQDLLANSGDSLIFAETQYAYASPVVFDLLGFRSMDGAVFTGRAYLQPRNIVVTCSDCPRP